MSYIVIIYWEYVQYLDRVGCINTVNIEAGKLRSINRGSLVMGVF